MQENFLKLAEREPHRFVVIDAGKKLEALVREVEAEIERFLSR